MLLKLGNSFSILLLFFCFQFALLAAGAQDKYKVEGTIVDAYSKLPLKNVSVVVKESKVGTVTNDSGYFSIVLFTPYCNIGISTVGYVGASRSVDLTADARPLLIELSRRADATLDEVIVNSYKGNSKIKTVEMNTVKINPELIKRTPLLFGEADIIKALALQPGVTTTGEGAGGFNVRGGNADQNLVLVDGAPMFNTSHLLGFFTSISPDAIQDVTLHKGSMPAQYGGRLSSLLNIKVKNGATNRMQYTTGLSPVSARIFVNGPLIKNKLTITAGGRAAYPDLILNQFPDKFGASRAFFYDGIVKAEYSINSNNKISVTGYRSFDKFRFDTSTSYNWESNLATLNYTSAISTKLSFRLNANYSQFIAGINGLDKDREFELNSSIDQKEAKAVFGYLLNDKHTIEAGVNYTLYGVSPGTREPNSATSNVNPLTIQKEQAREMAAFVSDEITFNDKIALQLGLRYSTYNYLGPRKVYTYEDGVPLTKETLTDSVTFSKNKNIRGYNGFEPRILLKIGLTDEMSLKFSYNRGRQFLHLISNTTSISPVDFWKLSDNYVKNQSGDQYAAGFFKSFDQGKYEFSAEAYYRTIRDMVEYKDGATLLLNQYIETALLNARGRGYGIEFSFIKNTGKITGQINYTYSKSEVQVVTGFTSEKVNDGDYYPSNNDRPHNLAIITKVKLHRGWSFNTNFVLTSGRPATYPDGNYAYNGTIVTNFSKRNMDRLPLYHRLDAGFSYVSRSRPDQKRYSIINISFYNVYAHQNAYSIYFIREDANLVANRLSVVGSVIPSLSWTYNF